MKLAKLIIELEKLLEHYGDVETDCQDIVVEVVEIIDEKDEIYLVKLLTEKIEEKEEE